MRLIPLYHPDTNDNQYESLKSMSEYFMYASVSKIVWCGHLKRLYDTYQKKYSFINSVSNGHIVPQLLDKSDDMIENYSLIKKNLENRFVCYQNEPEC